MPRSRLKHKVDGNHFEMMKDLRKCGAVVIDTARYGMSVDLIVVIQGRTIFVEVKDRNQMTKNQLENYELALTEQEVKMMNDVRYAGGKYIVATCVEEVLEELE